MAKPNLDHLLMTIHFIPGIPEQEHTALRKRLYHAFYYHEKGWQPLSEKHLATLVYGLQYIQAAEMASWEYKLHGCPNWRNT